MVSIDRLLRLCNELAENETEGRKLQMIQEIKNGIYHLEWYSPLDEIEIPRREET